MAAGVCSEGRSDEDLDIRRYAIALLYEFFTKKGSSIEVEDFGLMLRRIFQHIDRHINDEWEDSVEGLDLTLAVAEASRLHAARCGEGDLFIFRDGEAWSLFEDMGEGAPLLGKGSPKKAHQADAGLQPGDILVLCNPAVASVTKSRDITLILRRASDPPKASLFLSAIAERKGAEGPLTALIWEVPNLQGAAILTEDSLSAPQAEPAEEDLEEEGADQAKRHWLNLWRRRKS
ncbi:MAG: hypothetical protein SWK76_15710 [Actinomycetota bacterium]|nr:hypothetical protein [Actinomycetota bacterium]